MKGLALGLLGILAWGTIKLLAPNENIETENPYAEHGKSVRRGTGLFVLALLVMTMVYVARC